MSNSFLINSHSLLLSQHENLKHATGAALSLWFWCMYQVWNPIYLPA